VLDLELLAAMHGLDDEAPSRTELRAAKISGDDFDERAKAWLLTQEEPEPFRLPKLPLPQTLRKRLAGPLTVREEEAIRAAAGDEYLKQLGASKEYLSSRYPVVYLQTATGKLEFEGDDEAMADWLSLYAIIDAPARLFDELSSATLTIAQMDAMRARYPLLTAHIVGVFEELVAAERKKSPRLEFALPEWKDDLLRIVRGEPFDIVPPPPPPAQNGAPKPPARAAGNDISDAAKASQTTTQRVAGK